MRLRHLLPLALLFVSVAAHAQLPPPGGLVVGNGTTTGTAVQGGTAADCLQVGTGGRLTQTAGCGSAGAVTSWSAGTTGLTPNTATVGAVTLAGTLVAGNGGTGIASYTIGDLLYASGATTLSKLAGAATGNALISGGVATAPSWGKIALASAVSGILPGANGGTGVNNGSSTITLGGNLTTSGAFASTFTMTNTTAVTFPTTGTLATLAGSEALTNKSVNGLTITSTTGTLTLVNGSSLITAGAFSNTLTTTGTTNVTLPTTGTLATLAGTETFTNKSIGVVAFNETFTAPSISAGTLTINLSLGTVFNVANSANITTFTISNATASHAQSFTLVLTANGSGFTQAWGASVVWPGGLAPTLTTTNAKRDILYFTTNDGGTTWFATVIGQNY